MTQTDQRLAGIRVIPDRLVSLSAPDSHRIGQSTPPSADPVWPEALLAEGQRGFVANTSLSRQREPA